MTSAIQSMALSTAAEPMPWVARAKPASAPLTPFEVSKRYARPVPPAVPPGITWLTARLDRSMRSTLKNPGPSSGSTDLGEAPVSDESARLESESGQQPHGVDPTQLAQRGTGL